jgi:hypothetical protein
MAASGRNNVAEVLPVCLYQRPTFQQIRNRSQTSMAQQPKEYRIAPDFSQHRHLHRTHPLLAHQPLRGTQRQRSPPRSAESRKFSASKGTHRPNRSGEVPLITASRQGCSLPSASAEARKINTPAHGNLLH